MTLRVRTITVDCEAWEPLVAFWQQATTFEEDPSNPNRPGDPEGLLISSDQQIALLFIPVPEPKSTKNRMHLDLEPVESTRDEEVERLLGLGAVLVADHREDNGSGWVVLADPGGNEFCVERSAVERAG